uniref:hypothetical protein n=1 Tax=Campylobacter concisus TaxID=199 RepID=UPI00165323CA
LYSSGSNEIYKSYATKKILFLLAFIVFSYVVYKFLEPKHEPAQSTKQEARFVDLNTSDSKESKTISNSNSVDNSDINTTIFSNNRIYLRITCFPSGCKFRNYAIDLSLDSFLELLSFSNCHIFLQDKKSGNYIDYFVSCHADFERVLKSLENSSQGFANEKSPKTDSSPMLPTLK